MSSDRHAVRDGGTTIRPRLLVGLSASIALSIWIATQPASSDEAGPALRATTHAGADEANHGRAHAPVHAKKSGDAAKAKEFAAVIERNLAALPLRAAFAELGEAGRRSWSPNLPSPSAPASMPASAPLPQAPVFPYQWIGRSEPPLDDATSSATPASQKAFIAGPRTTWLVKPGDVIEGEWRVESVTATALQLTYLPLSSPQTISMPPP